VDSYKHRLVTIGDSMTMGFRSGAMYHADISYPVMLANALGIEGFRFPAAWGGPAIGGIPMNLETMVSKLSGKWWFEVPVLRLLAAGVVANMYLRRVENYWERGEGSKAATGNVPHHNLAVLTFGVSDAYQVTEAVCSDSLANPHNHWFLFNQVPELPIYHGGRLTLNPSHDDSGNGLTQVDNAALLARDGGIENLIINLGANNALGTVIDMQIVWSTSADLHRYPHQRACNLWTPEHFEMAYTRMAAAIGDITPAPKHVYVATIPYVTIAPVSRGAWDQDRDGYFEYYHRPWLAERKFRPLDKKDEMKEKARRTRGYLTRVEARKIDEMVDEYNAVIRREADRRGWVVVDAAAMLSEIAYRRNVSKPPYVWPQAAVDALAANPMTAHTTRDNSPKLDTRYLSIDTSNKVVAGGLFSLDGVHPTTIFYGLMADAFLKKMVRQGVRTTTGDTPALDWETIVASDSLVTNPPPALQRFSPLLRGMNDFILGRAVFRMLEKVKGNV
jgi:hypothetical protein